MRKSRSESHLTGIVILTIRAGGPGLRKGVVGTAA
jgi:hypothetical protein